MTAGRYDPGSLRPPGDSEAWDLPATPRPGTKGPKTVILDKLATHHA